MRCMVPIMLALLALPVSGDAAGSSAAEACQAAALSRPSVLAGQYRTYNVPNDNHYEIRFALPPLAGCDGLGKRKVTIFQQKLEPYGVRQTLQWSANGLSTSITTNQAKRGAVVLRAAHLCSPADAYGDFDRKHHIDVRPAVKITWQPTGGAPTSAVFSGPARPACKPGSATSRAAVATATGAWWWGDGSSGQHVTASNIDSASSGAGRRLIAHRPRSRRFQY